MPYAMHFPRILLIGRIGQVGWELRRTLAPLGQVVCVDYPEVDLTDGLSIRRWVHEVAPQIIINAAAYTAVDKAETQSDLAFKINGTAPGILAEEAKKCGALLIHYSTDYIFDGTKTVPYVEEDIPNPLGVYGHSKLAGDNAIRQVDGNHLIFRLCWVYGARGSNFLLTIRRLASEREKLRVVRDQFGCPTSSRMIAEATSLVLRKVLCENDLRRYNGTYNLAAAGSASWHRFAESIVALIPPEHRKCREVEPIPSSEYPTSTQRPPYSVLSTAKLQQVFGLRLPDWEDGLKLVWESMT